MKPCFCSTFFIFFSFSAPVDELFAFSKSSSGITTHQITRVADKLVAGYQPKNCGVPLFDFKKKQSKREAHREALKKIAEDNNYCCTIEAPNYQLKVWKAPDLVIELEKANSGVTFFCHESKVIRKVDSTNNDDNLTCQLI